MANFVALEINENQLMVATAKTSGRSLKINHAFSLDITADEPASELGERLKQELDSRGFARAEALCIVNRQQVEIREFSLPPAPDSELPNLVRFQAKSEFTALGEDWLLDYVPFDGIEDGPRRVLATAMSPEHIKQLTEITEAATIKFKRVLFRPYSLCDLMAQRLDDGEERLLIDPTGDSIDLTVTRGSQLLATRTVRISDLGVEDASSKKLVAEIRRTLASCSGTLKNQVVNEFVFCGSQANFGSTVEHLESTLECPVAVIEPASWLEPGSFAVAEIPEHVERFSSMFGALAQESSLQAHQLDLKNPRKPIIEKKFDQRKAIFYGSIAATVLLFGALIAWWMLSSLDSKIAKLEKNLKTKQDNNAGRTLGSFDVDKTISEIERLDDWTFEDLNWLDQLAELSDRMLEPKDVIIDSLTSEKTRIRFAGRIADSATDIRLKNKLQFVKEIKDEEDFVEKTISFDVTDGATTQLDAKSQNVDGNKYTNSISRLLQVEQDKDLRLREVNDLARERKIAEFEEEDSIESLDSEIANESPETTN